MSRHLISGGAGFLGSALAHRLIAEGHQVTVLDTFSRGKTSRIPTEARIVQGDIRDYGTVYWAVRDADVIWHLAYVQGTAAFYEDPKLVIDVALVGIMNVLRACEVMVTYGRNGSRELFLVSSSEVYADPPTFPTDETVPLSVPDVTNPRYSYGVGKIAAEVAALAYASAGLLKRTVIVRPHNLYGPDMGWEHVIPQFAERMLALPAFNRQPFPIQGTGLETRSFCHIDDAIDGLMVLLHRGADRNIYHLGNPGQEHRIGTVAALVAEYYGRSIEVLPGERLYGSPSRRVPDISKMEDLGYTPTISLREGLVPTLDWYRDNPRSATWDAAEGISRTEVT